MRNVRSRALIVSIRQVPSAEAITHQDYRSADPYPKHHNDNLGNEEPSNSSDCHDSPPEHGGCGVARLRLGRQGDEEKHIAKDEQDR
jgi:hypothetical protein